MISKSHTNGPLQTHHNMKVTIDIRGSFVNPRFHFTNVYCNWGSTQECSLATTKDSSQRFSCSSYKSISANCLSESHWTIVIQVRFTYIWQYNEGTNWKYHPNYCGCQPYSTASRCWGSLPHIASKYRPGNVHVAHANESVMMAEAPLYYDQFSFSMFGMDVFTSMCLAAIVTDDV